MKEDDEMGDSDEDDDEVDGELNDTEDFDGDTKAEVGEVGCEVVWSSWACSWP